MLRDSREDEAATRPDIVSRPIDADGLGVTFRSTSDEESDCHPVTLTEATALVASLRPLDPADDLVGAYRSLTLPHIPDRHEGRNSETLARLAFGSPDGQGGTVVETVRRTENRAVVLITTRDLPDESVRDRQVRAVFVHSDDRAWRLVSAGERYRCRPGFGHEDWSPEACR